LANQSLEVEGLENTVRAAADGCFSADAAAAIGSATTNLYFSSPDLASFGGDLYDQFLATYLENYGTEPLSVFHAHAFDATNLVMGCVETVAAQDADGALLIGRQAMRDCLYATSGYVGLTGTLTCNEFGDCADPKIAIYQIVGGEYVPFSAE